MVECKYLLPCGYCDKKGAPCTVVEFEKFEAQTQLANLHAWFGNEDSNQTCGTCVHTDGMCYTSNPPQIKCIHTKKFHVYGDKCDCEQYKSMFEPSDDLYKNKYKYLGVGTTNGTTGCTITKFNNSSEE